VAADIRTVFQLANSMLTVDEIEHLVLPGLRSTETAAETGAGAAP